VGIVIFMFSVFFGYLGNSLHAQSGPKYNHDVEEMRKTIICATVSISGLCMLSAGLFITYFALGNIDDMTDNMFMFGDLILPTFYSFYVLFGYLFLAVGVVVACYYRVVSGWDRMYLLPLFLPEIEAEMLK